MAVQEFVYKQFKFPENNDCYVQAIDNYLYINFVLKFSGMNMYSDDFSVFNSILMVTIMNVLVYLIVNTITIHRFWGDFLKVAYCIVPMGCGIQVTIESDLNCGLIILLKPSSRASCTFV
jgi:hypothetical protein